MDEIHEVTGMKLAELRDVTQKENIGEGWSRQSLELDELTAQGDKVNVKNESRYYKYEISYISSFFFTVCVYC